MGWSGVCCLADFVVSSGCSVAFLCVVLLGDLRGGFGFAYGCYVGVVGWMGL